MQVKHVSITAFEGIPSFEAPLHPLTLIAGPNGSGKSSLIEALRFALTGEVDRVKLKKDYQLLVTEGATKARVTIVTDDGEQITGLLPAGRHLNPIEPKTAGAYALAPERFMRMGDDDRRSLLFALSGDQGDVVELTRKRLTEKKVDAKRIDAIAPFLKIGFPEAHAQATKRVTEARASWRGITGEAYGVQKAEGWRPSTPITRPSDEALQQARDDVQGAKEAVATAAERVGQIAATLDPDTRAALKAQADPLERFKANLAEGERVLAEQKAQHAVLSETAAQSDGLCFECPCCGKPLRYAAGKVSERTADVEAATDANRKLQDLSRAIASTEQGLGTVRARVSNAQAAADRLAAAAESADPDADASARQALEDAQVWQDEATAALRELEFTVQRCDELDRKADEAARWHADAKAWGAVAEELAPDGLPNELLGWALKPVNDALRAGPEGWPLVQIRGDMTLTVDGRPYGLCSESEQWSADLLMATWMAQQAGTGIVLVDRFDVLQPSMRGPFLEWMADRTDAGTHQFVVAGTFASKPGIDYAAVYWMGERIDEAAAA